MRTQSVEQKNTPSSFLAKFHLDKTKPLTTLQIVQFQNFCYIHTSETVRLGWVKHFLKIRNISLTIPTNPKMALIQLGPACHLIDSHFLLENIDPSKIIEKIKGHLIPENVKIIKKTHIKINNLEQQISEKNENGTLSTSEKINGKFLKKQIEVGEQLDKIVDQFILGKTKNLVIPEGVTDGIIPSEWEKFHHELLLAQKNPYSDEHEAYSNLNKVQLRKLLEFINGILALANEKPTVPDKSRKSRAKRKVETFKHFTPLKEWDGIKGITQGKEVEKAKGILLYDTRNFKLGLIYPTDKFEIYRKSIKGIDDDKSIFKRIGSIKTSNELTPYMTGTFSAIRNKLEKIKKKNNIFSGLCSDNIIIIRLFT